VEEKLVNLINQTAIEHDKVLQSLENSCVQLIIVLLILLAFALIIFIIKYKRIQC